MKRKFVSLALLSVLAAFLSLSCVTKPFSRNRPIIYTQSIYESAAQTQKTGMEGAVDRAATVLIRTIPENFTALTLNISGNNDQAGLAVVEELKARLTESRKFKVLDEKVIGNSFRRGGFRPNGVAEGMSEVEALSFGRSAVANVVITVDIARAGLTQTLTVKAIDTTTSSAISMFRETF